MIARIHAFSRRFLMMLSGEMLQSAFGFALNIFLLRSLSAERYGVFAIVVLIGAFGILYMRALVGVPACTFIPQSRRPSIAVFYNVMFGSAALVAALIWACVQACRSLFGSRPAPLPGAPSPELGLYVPTSVWLCLLKAGLRSPPRAISLLRSRRRLFVFP